jgi:1-deoxy-D-xylulose-5-phosphate reductoisomerase
MPVAYGKLDWRVLSRLDFDLPDRESFRCLAIAEEAGRLGRSYPVWLNAANEVAVELFLQGALPWRSIADVVGGAVESCEGRKMNTVEEVEYEDELARQEARRIVDHLAS